MDFSLIFLHFILCYLIKILYLCNRIFRDNEAICLMKIVFSKYMYYLLAELKNRLKISIFLWRKKLCISLIFSNFVVSNYKVIYFTLCTTCMQIS